MERLEFKVVRDTTAHIFTVLIVSIMVGAIIAFAMQGGWTWSAWLFTLICFLTLGVALWWAPWRISVDSNELVVYRTLNTLRIPLSDIETIECRDITVGNIRIFGVGGLFGYTGWYRSPVYGSYFACMGSRSGTMLLTLRNGARYMLSCADPDSLISAVNARLS